MDAVFLTISMVLALYFGGQFLRVAAYKLNIPFNWCFLCASVYITWISALIFGFLPPIIIASLMGMSALAVADKVKELAVDRQWKPFAYRTWSLYIILIIELAVMRLKGWV